MSARRSTELGQALKAVPEAQWQNIDREAGGTLRQWTEVDFVPGEEAKRKDIPPLHYIGLRLLTPPGELFEDGHDRRHYAVLTRRDEAGDWMLKWHRDKRAAIEPVHGEPKTGWARAACPAQSSEPTPPGSASPASPTIYGMAVREAWPDDHTAAPAIPRESKWPHSVQTPQVLWRRPVKTAKRPNTGLQP